MLKTMVRSIVGMIGKDTIKEKADEFFKGLIAEKKEHPLLDGEVDIIGILYEHEGVPMYGIATIDANDCMVRYIMAQPVGEFIVKSLENL